MARNETVYDNSGNLIRTVAVDTDADTVTTTITGETPVVTALDPADKADILAGERRQLRAQRLADAIDSLKGPMDPTATIAALRSEVVALCLIIRDLVDEDA